ncbi:MAG: 3-hydroxyacyl-ACP dehydratase FabZ, partial [Puniceicoccales bacterium]|nr:3-hydroxyacyl-ACP dehydratase FabZ [Puniceicoccales bacterium]
PVSIVEGDRSLIALPHDRLKITCTSTDDRGIHTQHLSLSMEAETYAAEVAPARTFTFYEEIEPLLHRGKIKGGTLESAIVIKGKTVLSKEPLRFPDEFVRHKILDLMGDLALLGQPIKAHIVAVKPGHALNTKWVKAIRQAIDAAEKFEPIRTESNETALNIKEILQILPHRYPFVLLDRIVKIEGDTLQAIKNVSLNEPFFQGHFPANPIMPGVLQLEAMAQAAGILMSRHLPLDHEKLTFFMSADNVRFRQMVEPGDQLLIEARLVKIKNHKIGVAEGVCRVNGVVVSSANLMFMILDANR